MQLVVHDARWKVVEKEQQKVNLKNDYIILYNI